MGKLIEPLVVPVDIHGLLKGNVEDNTAEDGMHRVHKLPLFLHIPLGNE